MLYKKKKKKKWKLLYTHQDEYRIHKKLFQVNNIFSI
jgi:hypothetical protein